jgi:hypothetical protein
MAIDLIGAIAKKLQIVVVRNVAEVELWKKWRSTRPRVVKSDLSC